MRFVLANRHLVEVGGTEVHLVTIGEHLQRLGHEVVLYAPELGPYADHARRRGLDVAGGLRELPETCDVVFAQDSIVVHELAARYPQALSVFRICGDVFDFQLPPQVDGEVDLIVVLSDRYERLAAACAVNVPVVRLRVPIDIDRLVPAGAIRERPERAVLLGNYGDRVALVSQTWGALGIDVSHVGAATQTFDVAGAVADADIVVAKSRAALDAMACGRAVYILDFLGGDGWVTPQSYAAMEADMFAGQATDRVIDAAALAADLDGYRPEMGVVNRDLVVQHHSARDHVIALLASLGEHAPPRERTPRVPLQELSRLVAMQWSWELTAREFRALHWPLREHAARSEQASIEAAEAARNAIEHAARSEQASVEAAQVAQLERERADQLEREFESRLAAVQATRAWKFASSYWRLRERLRGRGR